MSPSSILENPDFTILANAFDARQVYRREWSLLGNKEEVQSACEVLTEEGWIKRNEILEKGKTKSNYAINPKVITKD